MGGGGIDESAFPIAAAVEWLRRRLHRAAHLETAVRSADRIGACGTPAIAKFERRAADLGRRQHDFVPAREHRRGVVVKEMDEGSRRRIESAPQRIGGG